MTELPAIAWIGSGLVVGGFSLYLGFLNPISSSGFFKLMFVIAIGMIVWGYVKTAWKQKPIQQEMLERRQQRYQNVSNEVDIDIDDYRRNPQLRQQAMQGYQQGGQNAYNGTPRVPPQNYQQRPQQYPQQSTQPQNNAPQYRPQQNYLGGNNPGNHANQQRFCPQCGSPLLSTHKFCPICGTRV